MSYKGKNNKGEKPRRTSEGLNYENLDSRSRGLSIEEEKSPRKKRGSGTPVSRAYFDTISVPKQDRTLFDELEEKNRGYQEAINNGSLAVPKIFGLPLSIRGKLVFLELLKTAIDSNNKLLHNLGKISNYDSKTPYRIYDENSISLNGNINLMELTKRVTGGERKTDIENTKKALAEFLDKSITIRESDGFIRVIKPIVSNDLVISKKGRKGDPVKIGYVLHQIFTVAISNQFYNLLPPYIIRGQRFPDWGSNLVDLLWFSAQMDLNNRIYKIKKADLFERIINLPEDLKKYKKNPQRKKQDFEKILSRLREVNLLIPGTHKDENGEEVPDNGYFETISHKDGSIISNFRLVEDLSEILLADENERLKLL